MIQGLMKHVGARDELLEQQEELLVQERKISEELKRLLALEKGKVEKLDQELTQSKETTCSLKRSIGALQGQHDILLKTHQDLEVQFDALWSSTSKTSINDKASTSQVSVETCDKQIAQENDHLKLEVKRLEQMVSKLVKQASVKPPQDNHRNTVNKLEKGTNVTKRPSQPSNKDQPLNKQQNAIEDEKLEYARSACMNAGIPHIKSGIGYKTRNKHNSRVNTKGQEFIKFTKANVQQEKKQSTKTTNNVSHSYANASHVSHISYHDLMLLRCL
jgi:hypothetical protein